MSLQTENKNGSDCSGNNGETNRVLTLSNTGLTQSSGFLVYVNGLAQTENVGYTVNHLSSSTTVTFLDKIFNSTPIIVQYYQTQVSSILSTRFIEKDLESKGNTITITEVSRSTGTDEYRLETDTETDHTEIPSFVQILDESDESVKQGEARSGDLIFYIGATYESYCTQGNKITYDSKTYQITDVRKFDVKNTTYLIECRVSQI